MNNYKITFFFMLLGEGEGEKGWMVMWKEMRRTMRKRVREVKGARDSDEGTKGLVMLFGYYLLL